MADSCGSKRKVWLPPHSERLKRKREQGWTIELHDMASGGMMENKLSAWGTPRVTTNGGHPSPQCTGKGSRVEDQVSSWSTPDCSDRRSKNSKQQGLSNQVEINWQTPESRNQKGYHVQKDGSKTEKLGTQVGSGKLNPDWVEQLMGLPVGWTQLSGVTDPHENRIDRLRLLGNGVVPATAEKAFRTLFERICRAR